MRKTIFCLTMALAAVSGYAQEDASGSQDTEEVAVTTDSFGDGCGCNKPKPK